MDLVDVTEVKDCEYVGRGARVARMGRHEIELYARRLCKALDLKNHAAKGQPIIQALESLRAIHNFPLDINPIEDEGWNLDGIEAMCDTESMAICMPNSLYILAAQNNPNALQILFHEVGHIFLGHKPTLHHSSKSKRIKEEDSEWQADIFAEAVMNYIMPKRASTQLELF